MILLLIHHPLVNDNNYVFILYCLSFSKFLYLIIIFFHFSVAVKCGPSCILQGNEVISKTTSSSTTRGCTSCHHTIGESTSAIVRSGTIGWSTPAAKSCSRPTASPCGPRWLFSNLVDFQLGADECSSYQMPASGRRSMRSVLAEGDDKSTEQGSVFGFRAQLADEQNLFGASG